MQIVDLTKNKSNPRRITKKRKELLKRAMLAFGDLSGVIFNRRSKQLVGGHQRRDVFESEKAQIVDLRKFKKPTKTGTVAEGVIVLKGERFSYREVDWDPLTEKAANLAANKSAGEFDDDLVDEFLQELKENDFDLSLTMFDDEDSSKSQATGVDEDEVPTKPKVARTQLNDLYLLGSHRLLCGDSTNEDHITRLMKDQEADICFTSPPYNLGTNAKLRGKNATGKSKIYIEDDDNKTQHEFLNFMDRWTQAVLPAVKYLFCNVQLLAENKIALSQYWYEYKDHLVDLMIWDKEHGAPAMAPNVLNSTWEFIFILSKDFYPKRSIKSGEEFRGTLPNIFRLNPVGKKDSLAKDHGAVFPVQFAEHFILNFTKKSVLDPFGGSGTTLIAAEKLKRKCFMMELDLHYCDVIVERWEKYTGLKAKLIRADKAPAKQDKKQVK